MIDPAIESHYGIGYERSRLFPAGRPEFFTTAYLHTPDGLREEAQQAGFTGVGIYGVEGPGWPLRREWADPHRREQILFAARAVESQPSLIGFSHHLIAAGVKAAGRTSDGGPR